MNVNWCPYDKTSVRYISVTTITRDLLTIGSDTCNYNNNGNNILSNQNKWLGLIRPSYCIYILCYIFVFICLLWNDIHYLTWHKVICLSVLA